MTSVVDKSFISCAISPTAFLFRIVDMQGENHTEAQMNCTDPGNSEIKSYLMEGSGISQEELKFVNSHLSQKSVFSFYTYYCKIPQILHHCL